MFSTNLLLLLVFTLTIKKTLIKSTQKSNSVCLKFLKFAHFLLVVLERHQPSFVLRIKIALNFMHLRSKSFKIGNFAARQAKSRREYSFVFSRDFVQY